MARDDTLDLTQDDLDEALQRVREGPDPDADELFVAGVRYGAEHLHRLLTDLAGSDSDHSR